MSVDKSANFAMIGNITTSTPPAAQRLFKVVAWVLVAISLIQVGYYFGYAKGLGEFASLSDFPNRMIRLHFWISFGVFASALAVKSRQPPRLVMSLVSLLFVLSVYGWWRLQTSKFLNDPDITKAREVHGQFSEIGWLHGATAWDFIVLSGVLLLFIWQVSQLVKVFFKPTSQTSSKQ